jgi:hypothetical protein
MIVCADGECDLREFLWLVDHRQGRHQRVR